MNREVIQASPLITLSADQAEAVRDSLLDGVDCFGEILRMKEAGYPVRTPDVDGELLARMAAALRNFK